MMITSFGFLTRILMVSHIKSINQGLCNSFMTSSSWTHMIKRRETTHF